MFKKLLAKIFTGESFFSFGFHDQEITDKTLVPDVDPSLTVEDKVSVIMKKMTLREKINLLAGEEFFAISATERLGLSRVWCTDASSGIRSFGRSTAFPALLALTASWNKSLFYEVGKTIAKECRAKGISVLLAPGVNIYRVPTNGRNFEYMGEDPYLISELVVPYIKGVQDNGVITTVKHFVANNSEYHRHQMNSIVDERTLHEIYFPAFKAAIQEGNSRGIMCAYNLLNGIHCSESEYLLHDILREKWKFDGFVISDWDSLYSTEGPMNAGLDLEMPKPKYYSKKRIMKALSKNKITTEDIDKKIKHLLHVFFEMGIYERSIKDENAIEFGGKHNEIALNAARESIVLLKNENEILPLNPQKEQSILIMGRNAHPTPTSGGGAGYVKAYENRSIFEAVKNIAGSKTKVTLVDYNKKKRISKETTRKIANADTIILCVGLTNYEDSECWDRSWEMPYNQSEFINYISSLNRNVIVVLNAGGGVETESWVHNVRALLHSFYLGQNSGTPVAEIIFGMVNPSAKLPFTMSKKWEDFASTKNYVEKPDKTSLKQIRQVTKEKNRFQSIPINYKEGIMVGYRHFDTNNIEPQFAFGFGLSYSKFEFFNLKISKKSLSTEETLKVSCKVKNMGKYPGKEIVQLYIKDKKSSLVRPEKELKDFTKVHLKVNEEKEIEFIVTKEKLSFYNPKKHKWVVESGEFHILIGSSSRDIRLKGTFVLEK